MDISDGLANSLFQLAKLNEIGFDVFFEDIPMVTEVFELAEKISVPVEDITIYFGGDYELVVTVESSRWSEAVEAVRAAGSKLTQIGFVNSSDELNLIKEGEKTPLENRGFEHFKWCYD